VVPRQRQKDGRPRCRRVVESPSVACASAQRDPDNGTPWLYAAAHALQRTSEYEHAIYRISKSTQFDLGFSNLVAFKNGKDLDDSDIFDRQSLATLVSGAYVTASLPNYAPTMDYCKADRLLDGNRKQICNELAERLVADGSALISVALGTKLAERLAWPQQRLEVVRERHDALREMSSSVLDTLSASASKDPSQQALTSCLWSLQVAVDFDQKMQDGEVSALRTRMANQPLTPTQLAQAYRTRMQKLREAAKPGQGHCVQRFWWAASGSPCGEAAHESAFGRC